MLEKPRALSAGATFAVAAPAFAVDRTLLDAGAAALRAAGYQVRLREDVASAAGYLAGSDARRAAELMDWIRDPDVDAILCARGGYGCHRIIPSLDAEAFRRARKPLLGYSDITTLHLWQARLAGLAGIHAPMLDHGALADDESAALMALLAGAIPGPMQGCGVVGGRAEGRLLGGSLTLLAASLGTPWEPDTRGAILLLEEIGERPYAIDRLLQQLACAGKLSGLAGIGVGHLLGCVDPKRPAPSAVDVVDEILVPLGVPLVTGLPFGHDRPNLPWPVGGLARLDGGRGVLEFLEPAVAGGRA